MSELKEVAKLIKTSSYGVAFTGAGISVESGIAPFTGAGGLWNQYDPKYIEINFFQAHPQKSWREMKKIFFNDMHDAQPNKAHEVLANLEKRGRLKGVITQNIDGLHQKVKKCRLQRRTCLMICRVARAVAFLNRILCFTGRVFPPPRIKTR